MDLLFAMALGLLQTPSSGCALLDASRPAQYLEFDHMGEGEPPAGESRHRVWLRLRNNTTCDMRLPLGVRRTCDGATVSQLKDGDCVRLNYSVFEGTPQVPAVWIVKDPAWDPSGGPGVGVVPFGTSVVFTVPQSHFIEDRMLAVAVAELRQDQPGVHVGGQHHVIFGRGDLPPAARDALRKD